MNRSGHESTGENTDEVGTVYLVGAGPGDPGLVTLRAAELIAAADVIFYDRLIPASALERARPGCELVYVGKSPAADPEAQGSDLPSSSQTDISRRLIEAAGRAGRVVRLKGGDPFLFGRGGEEAAELRQAGVPFEIVPGVTAGVAAPAYAGIPVTYRGQAGAVAFVTGHPARENAEAVNSDTIASTATHSSRGSDIEALANFPGTLVFYMGVRRLTENCAALIAAGRDPAEPAAVIERGTLPDQRIVHGDLGSIAELAHEARVVAPALLVVGSVVSRGGDLSWFEPGPLSGTTVVVTRASTQAGRTAARLRELGASAIELPTVRIVSQIDRPEVREAVSRLGDFDLVTLTSVNGVELLFRALRQAGLDARALAGPKLAAIGPATVEELRRWGLSADLVPPRAVAESLLDSLRETDLSGRRVLIAGAAVMRPVLAEGLVAAGADVDHLALYETVPEPARPDRLAAALAADFVTLASASAAHNLAAILRQAGAELDGRLVSIGPITTAAAREAGLTVDIEASPHTIEGIIEAIRSKATF